MWQSENKYYPLQTWAAREFIGVPGNRPEIGSGFVTLLKRKAET